jgi:nitrite reductase/ring-hydroxylating ferredoxin subunit
LSDTGAGDDTTWRELARARDVAPGTVVAASFHGVEYVVWRAHDGTLCAQPRACPHLDSDLTEACVVGDELVCAGHGWSFDTAGHAFKRTEHGRIDPKGGVEFLDLRERDGVIEGRARHYLPPA